MGKKRDLQERRNNKYSIQQARQELELRQQADLEAKAQILFKTEGADMPTVTASILKNLLKSVDSRTARVLTPIVMLAILAYFVTSAQKQQRPSDVTVGGTIKTNSSSTNRTENVTSTSAAVSSSICNGTLEYGNRQVNLTCTESAQEMFRTDGKASYKNILNGLNNQVNALRKQKMTKCKMDSIAADSNFSIELFSPSDAVKTWNDTGRDIHGSFLSTSSARTMRFRADQPVSSHTIVHENHHGFIFRQNEIAQRVTEIEVEVQGEPGVSSTPAVDLTERRLQEMFSETCAMPELEASAETITTLASVPAPFGNNGLATAEEKASFKSILELGTKRVLDYIELLKTKPDAPAALALKEAAKNYTSHQHQFYFDDSRPGKTQAPQKLTSEKPKENPPKQEEQLMLALVEKREIGSDVRRNYVIFSPRHYSKEMLALLDFKEVLKTLEKYKNKGDVIHLLEYDTFIHQVYEQHPALFSLLFPELLAHHDTRTDEAYKACLRS